MSAVKLNEERLKLAVERVLSVHREVEAVVVVTSDGFPVYSMVDGKDQERAAAMGASFVSLAKRVAKDLRGSDLKKVIVETDRGRIIGVPLAGGLSILMLVR